MLRSILIGLDGSPCSGAAVELGIRWARRFDARLIGLAIVDEPTICRPEPVPMGAGCYKYERDQRLLASARRRVDGLLASFARRCAASGVDHDVVHSAGLPYIQILRESGRGDLVMLGQRTNFHFEAGRWPDETLREVLRRTSRPVVIVPAAPAEGSGVVVAYDGGVQVDRALQAFAALGLAGDEEVRVISAHGDLAVAAERCARAVDFLTRHGARATSHPLPSTAAVDKMILAESRETRARLVVMGAYGRSMWRELVFGSITTTVLRESAVPLFLCR